MPACFPRRCSLHTAMQAIVGFHYFKGEGPPNEWLLLRKRRHHSRRPLQPPFERAFNIGGTKLGATTSWDLTLFIRSTFRRAL